MSSTPITLVELERLEKRATGGPWRWMDAALNDRLAKRLGKPRNKLSKRDGLLVVSLKGEPNGWPDAPDEILDRWDYRTVFELAWSSVRGDEIGNASPGPADRELITAIRNTIPDLLADLRTAREALEKIVRLDSFLKDPREGPCAIHARTALAAMKIKES